MLYTPLKARARRLRNSSSRSLRSIARSPRPQADSACAKISNWKKKQNKKTRALNSRFRQKNPSKLNSFRNKNGYIFMTKVLQYLTLLRQRGTRFAQVTNMSYLIFLGSGFWLFCLRIAWIRTDLRDRYCASFFHSSPNSLATYWSMSSLFGPIVHRNIYLIKVMLLPVHCKHMVI